MFGLIGLGCFGVVGCCLWVWVFGWWLGVFGLCRFVF